MTPRPMTDLIHTKTQFVIQADKGRAEWYDFSLNGAEDVARTDLTFLRHTRDWEKHRLVRRITLDTLLDPIS